MWKYFIIGAFSLFALMIIILMIISMNQRVDLVSENYYESELKYQDEIDKMENASGTNIQCEINSAGDIQIAMPQSDIILGEAHFYKPENAEKDFKVTIKGGEQIIDKSKFTPGIWKVKINWNENGRKFYNEKRLVIQ